jgi:hypothetical protein
MPACMVVSFVMRGEASVLAFATVEISPAASTFLI